MSGEEDQTRDAVRQAVSDIGRIVSPHGIDEARYVTIGGARQWITIRGQDRRQPILLFLHGGPGGALSDISWLFQRPWEDYFTVVHWDQRGFGRSAIDGARLEGTINLGQVIRDCVELIDHLRQALGQDKVILFGQSWGSILAVEVAHRRPDLLHAVVTTGLNTGNKRNFEETRRLLLGHAREHGEIELAERLAALGPIPRYEDFEDWVAWVGFVQTEMVRRGYSWRNFQGPGPDWNERIIAARAVSPLLAEPPPEPDPPFTNGPATPHREIGVSADDWMIYDRVGTRFEIPFVLIMGAFDWQTPITLARDYYAAVSAPYKSFVEFPNSAHAVLSEEPGRMIVTLVKTVLPAVEGRIPPGAETGPAAQTSVASL